MNNTIFIDCPWSNGANGIYVTSDQTKEVFNLIVKVFLTKYKCEKLLEQGEIIKAKPYDLNDIKVFNKFVDLTFDNILDPNARDYVLETIRVIRDNNFKRKSVKISYYTLYKTLDPDTNRLATIRTMLSENMQIIDFCRLLEKCNKSTLTNDSPEIKEINTMYNIMKDMGNIENNLL